MSSRRAIACVAALLGATAVEAQETPDEIARRGLIEQAEGARAAGDHARALDLASRAGAIRMTPSVRQLVAYEHDAVGHPLEALDAAERCEREARTDAALRNRERILEACGALAATLRGRVGWVTVRVPAPAPRALRVSVGDVALGPALWGVERPALPGPLAVDAAAEGGRFHRVLVVAAGAHAEVVVDLTTTAPVAPRPRVGAGPWVVVGAGGLALVAAGAFAALRADAMAERDRGCDARGCDPDTIERNARFERYTVLTDVALGLGVAAVLGGAAWYVVARATGAPPRAAAASFGVTPLPSGAVLSLGGAL